MILGESPLHELSLSSVLQGFLAHQVGPPMLWSRVFGGIVGLTLRPFSAKRAVILGALVGALALIVDGYLLVPGVQRQLNGRNLWAQNVPLWVAWATHLVFGISSGFFYWRWQPQPYQGQERCRDNCVEKGGKRSTHMKTRLLILVTMMGAAATARAEVKVADDVWNGAGRFSRMDYGISERFQRAWLVLHYTSKGPCPGTDGECEFDDPVRIRVPGLSYDPTAKQVLYREEGAAPALCAHIVRHRFIRSWETIDETGQCTSRIANVDSFMDDGYDGREDRRKPIYFGVGPPTVR